MSDKKIKINATWVAKGIIFIASFLAMLLSIYLFDSGDTLRGVYVGLWVPSILGGGALLFAGTT